MKRRGFIASFMAGVSGLFARHHVCSGRAHVTIRANPGPQIIEITERGDGTTGPIRKMMAVAHTHSALEAVQIVQELLMDGYDVTRREVARNCWEVEGMKHA